MKNQTSGEQQQTLLEHLPQAVQNRQQPELPKAELLKFKPATPANRAKAGCFCRLEDAVEFLENKCGFLVVQVQIVPAVWKLVGPQRDFGIDVNYEQLLAFANNQHKALARLARANGLDRLARLLESDVEEPAQQSVSWLWSAFDQKQVGSLTKEVNR